MPVMPRSFTLIEEDREEFKSEEDRADNIKAALEKVCPKSVYKFAVPEYGNARTLILLVIFVQWLLCIGITILASSELASLSLNYVHCRSASSMPVCTPMDQPLSLWRDGVGKVYTDYGSMFRFEYNITQYLSDPGAAFSTSNSALYTVVLFTGQLVVALYVWPDVLIANILLSSNDTLMRLIGCCLCLLVGTAFAMSIVLMNMFQQTDSWFAAALGMLSLLFLMEMDEKMYDLYQSTKATMEMIDLFQMDSEYDRTLGIVKRLQRRALRLILTVMPGVFFGQIILYAIAPYFYLK